MRRSWPVESYGRKYLALRREDLRPNEQALDPAAAWKIIEMFVQRPQDSGHLAALARAAAGGSHASTFVNLPALEKAFTSGQMVLMPRYNQAPTMRADIGSGESIAEQIKKAREVKTWVEFEVIDTEGKPSSNLRYRCMLPDGSLREGMLDSRGRARYDGIDEGNCVFELLDLDNDAWQKIA
jgi:hypothetical protein